MKEFCRTLIKKYTKTVGDATEIDEMTAIALFFQRIFGHQILDPEWTWKRYFVHNLMTLLLFIYVFFGTLQYFNTTNDPELSAEACYTLIMIGIFPVKMLLFIGNRSIFRKLYITAKSTLVDLIKADPMADIGKVLKTGKKIVYTLYSMVLVPCSIYEATTFWNYVNGRRVLLSPSTMTLMPMTTPYHEIAWILHTVFLLEISSTIILDMWFVLLIYFFCAASDSLERILNVRKRNKHESKIAYATRLRESLKKFYSFHVKQIEYLNMLSSMYKWLAFVPLCNAAICTCIILLVMSKDMNWRFAPHMLPMFAEIFAYNWFGEQIKTKASNLHMALLNFDWMNLQPRDKKRYYIVVAYMQKDCGLNTGIGNDLSLITMTAVLKASYQAFTVLKTMDK